MALIDEKRICLESYFNSDKVTTDLKKRMK